MFLFLFVLIFSVTKATEENFQTVNKLFTSSVYTEISKTLDGNFLVSPFSAVNALSYVLSGARGQSAEELRGALKDPTNQRGGGCGGGSGRGGDCDRDHDNQTRIESEIKSVLPTLKENTKYTLKTVNKIYIKNNYTLNEDFKNRGTTVYDASSEEINFGKNDEAAKVMNGWVEEQTDGKIKNLINPNDLDIWTRAILLNAIYFKANWSRPFYLENTERRKFYKTANDIVEVDSLRHLGQFFNYYECPHLKAKFLEMPFKGGEASMVFVLPNEKDGLLQLEKQLDVVFSPQHELKSELLNVVLPKFRIESSIDLKAVLENLGVDKIFDSQKADLSGVAGAPGDLYLNKVTQKSFIDVSEEGVEAAAATFAVIIVPKVMVIDVPKEFIADHPFIFYIKIKGFIVFAGRVTDPSLT